MTRLLHFFRERVWSALPAEITPRMRRIAGVAWPAFLLIIGGVVAWKRLRHGQPLGAAPVVLWALAPGLAALLMVSRSVGEATYRAVMLFFATLGFFVSHAVLLVFFYLVVTPLSLLLRLLGKDLIDTRRHRPTWTPHAGPPDRRRFYRLF